MVGPASSASEDASLSDGSASIPLGGGAIPGPDGSLVPGPAEGSAQVETMFEVEEVAIDDSSVARPSLKVGQSATIVSADSREIQYAVSSACTMSTTVYDPYRKYSSGSYWATAKVTISRSSGCASKDYFDYLSWDSGWLSGWGSVAETRFTAKPGYSVTAWASRRCVNTSTADWKTGVAAAVWGDIFSSSGPTALSCRP